MMADLGGPIVYVLIQAWKMSQAPQTCPCKFLLGRVNLLAEQTLFVSHFVLFFVQLLGVVLPRVRFRLRIKISPILPAALPRI